MKLAVIGGAGLLGSTTAFYAGSYGYFSEIKLIDINEKMVMSHVMDMEHAFSSISNTKVLCSYYKDIGDCQIVLITASLPERNVSSRNEYLKGNLKIVESVCKEISKQSGDRVIVNATNPVDVFNYVIYRALGYERERIVGFSLNDTIRLKWAIAKLLNKESTKVNGFCIGEHGDNQVPLYEKIEYNKETISLNEEQKEEASKIINNWFGKYQGLQSGRTTGWTSAVGLTKIIHAIAKENDEIIPCSAVLEGEYGLNNLSIGVPVRLSRDGIKDIIQFDLSKEQSLKLKGASKQIKKLIQSIGY